MIRAVLDTNVIVSGVLRYDVSTGTPAELLRRWLASAFELVISEVLTAEIERTLLQKPYFAARIEQAVGDRWISTLASFAILTAITTTVSGVASHPEDDLVLATAVSAQAEYLVTDDKQLLRLRSYRGVAIISPSQFLAVLDAQGHPDQDETGR